MLRCLSLTRDGFACSCPESERQSSTLYQHLNTMHCISLEIKLVREEGEVLRRMEEKEEKAGYLR